MATHELRQGQDRIPVGEGNHVLVLNHPGGLVNVEFTSDDGAWDFAMYDEAGVRVAGGGNSFNVGNVMPAGRYEIRATYSGNEAGYRSSEIKWIVRSTNVQPDRYPPGGRQPPRRFGSNKTPGPVARALRWMTGRG